MITVEKAPKNDLWNIVKKQEQIYGNVATPEINWNKDVGEEKFN